MPWFYSLLFHKSHHRMEMRKKIVLKKYPYCLNFDITKDETKKSVSERIFFGSINLYCFSFVLSWFYWFLKFPCFFHSAWFYFLHHNKNQNSNSPGSAFVFKKKNEWQERNLEYLVFFWTWKLKKVIEWRRFYNWLFFTILYRFTHVFHLSKMNRFQRERIRKQIRKRKTLHKRFSYGWDTFWSQNLLREVTGHVGDGFLYKGKLIAETVGVHQRNSIHLYIKKKELEKPLVILVFLLSLEWH